MSIVTERPSGSSFPSPASRSKPVASRARASLIRDLRFCVGSRNCANPASPLLSLSVACACSARRRARALAPIIRLTAPVMRLIVPCRGGAALLGSAPTLTLSSGPTFHPTLRVDSGPRAGGVAATARAVACDRAAFHRRAAAPRPSRLGRASLTPGRDGLGALAVGAAGRASAAGAWICAPFAPRLLRLRGLGCTVRARRLWSTASWSALSRSGRASAGARASLGMLIPSRSRVPRK